jgi:uncharacterized protein YcfL
MQHIKNQSSAIILTALLLLSACASHQPPPAPGSINSKVDQLGEMVFLQIIDIRTVQHNHLLNVQATVVNTDSYNRQLYYRFKWQDANGFEVGQEETWKPVLLYGYQKQVLTAVAPSPQATDFRLVVQTPENTGQMP